MSRYLKVATYSVVAALLVAGVLLQQKKTARINGEREASAMTMRIWNECSLKGTECKGQYPAYLRAWDQAAQNAQLLKGMEKEIAAETVKQELGRKVELIEAAIKSLEKLGVTEDDLKEYFRETIREEEREAIVEEERVFRSEE